MMALFHSGVPGSHDSEPAGTISGFWGWLLIAALINIFMLTVDQIIMCNVKAAAHDEKPIENEQPTLHFRTF